MNKPTPLDPLLDKHGRLIEEMDLLKVYHFTGARRKKQYMYKQARKNKDGHLVAFHIVCSPEEADSWCSIRALGVAVTKTPLGWSLYNVEIIQSLNWKKLDSKPLNTIPKSSSAHRRTTLVDNIQGP